MNLPLLLLALSVLGSGGGGAIAYTHGIPPLLCVAGASCFIGLVSYLVTLSKYLFNQVLATGMVTACHFWIWPMFQGGNVELPTWMHWFDWLILPDWPVAISATVLVFMSMLHVFLFPANRPLASS
jgi:hypothetical protein